MKTIRISFTIENKEGALEFWKLFLEQMNIYVDYTTGAHIVNEMGKVTKSLTVIHCKTTKEDYTKFKMKYPFGILL